MSFDKPGKFPFPPKPERYPVQDRCRPMPPPEDPNRMYSGNRPIAYLDDLKALHNEVLRWLMGPDNNFGRNGYLPLLPDGTIDMSFLKDEVVGIDVFNNLENIGYNVKTIEFRGNLVKVVREDDGKVIVYIHEPYASHLGTRDGKTDGFMYLTKQSRMQCVQAICPIGPDSNYFGLEPGSIIKAFKPTNRTSIIEFETKEPIYFFDKETKFEVALLNAMGQQIFVVESALVTADSTNVIYTDNRYCALEITEFEKESTCYHAKIKLKIKLNDFFRTSTKFNIRVTHFNSRTDKVVWTSKDLFYLVGQTINTNSIDMSAKIYINGNEATPQLEKVCGINYVKNGSITFTATGINNINNALIAGAKIKFESNVTDEEYIFSNDDIDYGVYIDLDTRAENCVWSHTFKIKQNFLYPTEKITAKLTIVNGFGEAEKVWEDVRVKYLNETAYINTKSTKFETDKITEGFTGNRFTVSDLNYLEMFPLTFNNLAELTTSEYLQVIKGVGLVWPNYFGQRASNTAIKYYNCIFTGDDTNTSKVWGGTFIFGNLTLAQFNKGDFNVRISLDDTTTWYDLNAPKDGDDVFEFDDYYHQRDKIKGILCSAEQVEGGLAVRFAFPQNICYNHDDIICFKLAMKSTSSVNLTYIKLRNEDNTKDY